MKYSRVIGQNIQLVLEDSGITFSQLREKLGYSEKDLCRILEGVLLVDSMELDKFAKVLGVELGQLTEPRDEKQYRELIHCMGEYHDVSNKDKILDYIDLYIELAEVVG